MSGRSRQIPNFSQPMRNCRDACLKRSTDLSVSRNQKIRMLCGKIFVCGLLAVGVALHGCGRPGPSTYPVSGKVTFPDGTPVTAGFIEFESKEPKTKGLNARGKINEDGSFTLSTVKLGDGAVIGRHLAIVREPYRRVAIEEGERLPPAKIDRKFRSYETSGLEFEVLEQSNELTVIVTPPATRGR